MYVPDKFRETRIEVLHGCIRQNPFGTLVTLGSTGLTADHIPFLIDPDPAPFGTLRGHVARANPVWREHAAEQDVLVIFQGFDVYVSPSWYAAKQEHGKVVPTWNYVVVHAHGQPRFIEDRAWLHSLVSRLTNEHESARRQPWKVTDAPEEYITQQLRAIVGVEVPIARLVGKWKASQNRTAADIRGVIEGLREERNGFLSQMRDPDSQ